MLQINQQVCNLPHKQPSERGLGYEAGTVPGSGDLVLLVLLVIRLFSRLRSSLLPSFAAGGVGVGVGGWEYLGARPRDDRLG